MAMALFTIAAVSLAGALNLISLTVGESISDAEVRDSLRSMMLEITRDPAIREETRETNPDERGLFFHIEVKQLTLTTEDAIPLQGLFEVTVTALQDTGRNRRTELDSATTYSNVNLL